MTTIINWKAEKKPSDKKIIDAKNAEISALDASI